MSDLDDDDYFSNFLSTDYGTMSGDNIWETGNQKDLQINDIVNPDPVSELKMESENMIKLYNENSKLELEIKEREDVFKSVYYTFFELMHIISNVYYAYLNNHCEEEMPQLKKLLKKNEEKIKKSTEKIKKLRNTPKTFNKSLPLLEVSNETKFIMGDINQDDFNDLKDDIYHKLQNNVDRFRSKYIMNINSLLRGNLINTFSYENLAASFPNLISDNDIVNTREKKATIKFGNGKKIDCENGIHTKVNIRGITDNSRIRKQNKMKSNKNNIIYKKN